MAAVTTKDHGDDQPTPFEEALDKTGNGLYNFLLVATCSLILLAIGVDLFGFSLVVAAACDLNLTVSQKGILTSLPFVGILLVSYLWGYVSDTKGRRFTLVIPLLLSFILSCISSLSPHWLFLGFVKFLCVCFACAANSATYTLVGESCTARVRNRYMLLMTCLILLSPAVAGVLTYPTLKLDFAVEMSWFSIVYRPWRLLIVVLAIPSGLGALAIYFFCESPKFLFNSGRNKEALDVLRHIHAVNHRNSNEEYTVEKNTCPYLAQATTLQKRYVSPPRHVRASRPLFRALYLCRSLQLFYIVAVAYIIRDSVIIMAARLPERVSPWCPDIKNSTTPYLLHLGVVKATNGPKTQCTEHSFFVAAVHTESIRLSMGVEQLVDEYLFIDQQANIHLQLLPPDLALQDRRKAVRFSIPTLSPSADLPHLSRSRSSSVSSSCSVHHGNGCLPQYYGSRSSTSSASTWWGTDLSPLLRSPSTLVLLV
ncbi:unnamed protein product [Chrysodeixis includens]|uniref:Uncharacterized protein n=1 Tax=Chrysodeixis includens TaxID=689277 RepID=A0A9P0E4U5_CHRIL|nr:unnamed protein product [Chrysodeixis includens]